MRTILVVFLLLVLAGVGFARLLPGEYRFTADQGLNMSQGHYTSGPGAVDIVATDGTATVVFYWFEPADRSTLVRTRPYDDKDIGTGTSAVYNLREGLPRHFDIQSWGSPDGPDSCYVNLVTASEVIMTW